MGSDKEEEIKSHIDYSLKFLPLVNFPFISGKMIFYLFDHILIFLLFRGKKLKNRDEL